MQIDMKKRVIFFGCSNTHGYGLEDCLTYNSKPSKLGWASYIASELGRTYVNKGIPGASNKLIWYKILHTKFKPDDIVIILWSYPNRTTVLNSPWSFTNVYHNQLDQPESLAYYTHLYSKYDTLVTSKLYIDSANRYLNDLKIPVYQTVCYESHKILFDKHKHIPLYFSNYLDVYPKAMDDNHLGISGNMIFAKDFLRLMDTKIELNKTDKFINWLWNKIL